MAKCCLCEREDVEIKKICGLTTREGARITICVSCIEKINNAKKYTTETDRTSRCRAVGHQWDNDGNCADCGENRCKAGLHKFGADGLCMLCGRTCDHTAKQDKTLRNKKVIISCQGCGKWICAKEETHEKCSKDGHSFVEGKGDKENCEHCGKTRCEAFGHTYIRGECFVCGVKER